LFPTRRRLPSNQFACEWNDCIRAADNVKVRIKVKGSGQECPLHTGKNL
jgi:hypothetical protein